MRFNPEDPKQFEEFLNSLAENPMPDPAPAPVRRPQAQPVARQIETAPEVDVPEEVSSEAPEMTPGTRRVSSDPYEPKPISGWNRMARALAPTEYNQMETQKMNERKFNVEKAKQLKEEAERRMTEGQAKDPNSVRSKKARAEYIAQNRLRAIQAKKLGDVETAKMFEEMAQDAIGKSAYDLGSALQEREIQGKDEYLSGVKNMREQDIKEEALDFKKGGGGSAGKDATKYAIHYQKEFNTATKEHQKSLAGAKTVDLLLDDAVKNGGQSLAAVGPKMAKALGEVGVLTEADVTRYVKNPQLIKSISGSISRAVSGKMIQSDYDNLKRLVSIISDSEEQNIQDKLEQHSYQFSEATGLPQEEAAKKLYKAVVPKKSEDPSEIPAKKEDRVVGKVYTNPAGKKAKWTGTGWEGVK